MKIEINPKAITAVFARNQHSALDRFRYSVGKLFLPPHVRRGRWDLRAQPIETFSTLRFMKAGLDSNWKPAAVERALVEYYRSRRRDRGLLSAEVIASERLERVLTKYRALADNMARNGYVPGVAEDEVGIAIGRDGRFIKIANGNHRFALAVLLGLPTIVAEVSVVHVDWYSAGPASGWGVERIHQRLKSEGFVLWDETRTVKHSKNDQVARVATWDKDDAA